MAYKLLLADDSITIQKVVELILSEDEFSIVSVGSGQEAWDKLEHDLPDIILADIEMPELDGYELCRKVKKDPKTSHIPVILLAGAFESFDTARAKEVGAADHVIKPFESSELIGKINGVLEGAAPLEELAAEAVEAEAEDSVPVMEFDDEDVVAAEIEEEASIVLEPGLEAVEAEPAESGDEEDLWGSEEIPEVGEATGEWEDDLGGSVQVEGSDETDSRLEVEIPAEAAQMIPEPATVPEETAAEAVELEEGETGLSEAVAFVEEESFPGDDAGTEEMELAEDAEAVEEEFAEQIEAQEAAAAPAPGAPVAQVSVSGEDVKEALRAAVAAAMPSAQDIRGMVNEVVSAAVAIPDAGDILAEAAKSAFPDSSAVTESVKDAMAAQDLGGIARTVLQEEIQGALQGLLKQTIESILWEVLPEAAERVTREIIEEQAPASLKNIFEKVAWETVPDVAERLITAEIERIKEGQ